MRWFLLTLAVTVGVAFVQQAKWRHDAQRQRQIAHAVAYDTRPTPGQPPPAPAARLTFTITGR
jgi:hypothetical protein